MQHDTPEDHVVMGLRIEAALLPEWFERVKTLVGRHGRRMMVVEKPDEWVLQIEVHRDRKAALGAELEAAWQEFVAGRKAEGRWG